MIRAVLDTNVIVASLPAPDGLLAELAERWLSNRFELVASEHILAEAAYAWDKRYWRSRIDSATVAWYLELLRRRADIVPLTVVVNGVATHRQDDLVLATALSGDAGFVVTGDKEFLRLRHYQGIDILSPRDFLPRLDEAEPA